MGTIFIVALGSFGINLLVLGLRWRYVGNQPTCRNCGYDLTGKPPDSTRCPECGSDLQQLKAVAIGRRQRHPRLILTGAMLLALVIPAIIVNTNWQRLKPVWWLRSDLRGGSDTQVDALNELQRRLKAKVLTADQIDWISDRCLEAQADVATPWLPGWGDFIESAHASGQLDAKRWTTYVKQAGSLDLSSRPMIAQGDLIPLLISSQVSRASADRFVAYLNWSNAQLDGKPVEIQPKISGSPVDLQISWQDASGSVGFQPYIDHAISRQLKPGAHKLTISLNVRIYKMTGIGIGYTEPSRSHAAAVFDVTLSTVANIIAPADAPRLTFVDPTLREKVRDALSVGHLTLYRKPHSPVADDQIMEYQSSPARLEFLISARLHDGKKLVEIPMGSILCETGQPMQVGSYLAAWNDPDGIWERVDKVDLIFRPDLDYIEKSPIMTPCWGEPVIIDDVPIERK
jgi:hypothetical protein